MSADAPEQARQSISGALAAAQGDPGLVHAARAAFVEAMSTTLTMSAAGVLAAAVLATVIMRRPQQVAEAAPVEEPALSRLTPTKAGAPSGAPAFFGDRPTEDPVACGMSTNTDASRCSTACRTDTQRTGRRTARHS